MLFYFILEWAYHSKYLNLFHFVYIYLKILVCCNHMTIQDEVTQVVIHELIHAYDDCRAANLDWANCAHHACSEVRISETTSLYDVVFLNFLLF